MFKHGAAAVLFVIASGCGDKSTARAIDSIRSTLAVDRSTGIVADGVDAVHATVTVVDSGGTPYSGCSVTLDASGSGNAIGPLATTGTDGSSTTTITSTVAEAKTLTASARCGTEMAAIGVPISVTFEAVMVAPIPTLTLDTSSAPADGIAVITATVHVVDNNQPVAGEYVTITMSGTGNVGAPTSGTTDALGEFHAALSSTVAEAKTITAVAEMQTLTSPVTFVVPRCTLMFPGLPATVIPDAAKSIFAGDVDGDGREDLAITQPANLAILRGLGNGRFRPPMLYPTGEGTTAVTGGDFDHHGDLDFAVITTSSLVVFLDANGVLGAPTTIPLVDALDDPLKAVVAGDLDGNGTVDLAVRSESNIIVLLGVGDGTFAAPTSYPLGFAVSISSATIALGDVDNDTRPDVITVGSNSQLSVLRSNANGTLQAPVTTFVGDYSMGPIAVGDFDHDTHLDVIVDGLSGAYFERGHGDGGFTAGASFSFYGGFGAIAGDFNNDGMLDVITGTNASVGEVRLLAGNNDGTFQPPQVYALNQYVAAMAVADFDGDGRADLAVAEAGFSSALLSELTIMSTTPTGTLTGTPYIGDIVGPTRTTFVPVAGDFNDDGYVDLVGHTLATGSAIELADANGTLTAATPASFLVGDIVVVGDFDNDGRLDLVYDDGTLVRFAHGVGDGTLAATTIDTTVGGYGAALTAADFNHDGKLDLAIANQIGLNSITIAFGHGDGSFGNVTTYPVGTTPIDIDAADLNGDGNLDLVVSNRGGSSSISVLVGSPTGTFAAAVNYPVAGEAWSTAVGDFDSDGKPDLAVATGDTTSIGLLLGHGDGSFGSETTINVGASQYWIGTSDLDGDGKLDLLVGTRGLLVLLGNGDATFAPPALYDAGSGGFGIVVTDFNHDGRDDVLAPALDPNVGVGFSLQLDRGCR